MAGPFDVSYDASCVFILSYGPSPFLPDLLNSVSYFYYRFCPAGSEV